MNKDLVANIRRQANAFADQIGAMVEQSIEAELSRVFGASHKAQAGVARSKAAARPLKTRKRRAGNSADDGKVLGVLSKTKGLTARQISEAARLAFGKVGYRLDKLRKQKKVRMTGLRSTALYFAA